MHTLSFYTWAIWAFEGLEADKRYGNWGLVSIKVLFHF